MPESVLDKMKKWEGGGTPTKPSVAPAKKSGSSNALAKMQQFGSKAQIETITPKPEGETLFNKLNRLTRSFFEGATPRSTVEMDAKARENLARRGIDIPGFDVPELRGTTGEKVANIAGSLGTGLIGGAGAYGVAGKALAPVASRLSPTVLQLLRGSAAGGVTMGAEGVGEGRPVGEIAKNVALGTVLGGVGDVALSKVGAKMAAFLKKQKQPATTTVTPEPLTPAPKPKPLLLEAPKAQFEAGTRTVMKPTEAALEAPEARLNRIMELIKPETERQVGQAQRIRKLISEFGAPPIEAKKPMADFLAKALPDVPKGTWQKQSLDDLVNFTQSLAKGAEPQGMPAIASRVAQSKGIDLDFEFALADMVPEQRAAELAKRNYWAKIIGLDSDPGALTQAVDEPFVRILPTKEVKSGAAMSYNKQRIVKPDTEEWQVAIDRINNIKPTPQSKAAVIDEAKNISQRVMKEAASPNVVPEAILATYPKTGNMKEFTSRVLSSVEGWLKTKGQPGQNMVNMIRQVETIADQQAAKWGDRIFDKVAKLSKEEQINLRSVVRGKETPANDKVANAAREITAYYTERPTRISQSGLTLKTAAGENIPFQAQQNHFPLRLDWKKIEDAQGNIRPDILQQLVQTGQAKNIQEADRMLKALRRLPFERHATFQHEASRIELPEYELPPLQAIRADLLEGETRIAQGQVFGSKDERLIAEIQNLRPEDQQFGLKLADRLRGLDARSDVEQHLIEGLLNYNVISKLGLAAIPNATQNVNSALMAGTKNLIRGVLSARGNPQEAREFAIKAGVYLDPSNVAKAIAEMRGGTGEMATKFLRATGFNMTEYWNRLIAAQTGKAWADDMFQALQKGSVSWVKRVSGKQPERIRRIFKDIGVNVDEALKRGALTEDELALAGRYVVQRTQFAGSNIDIPLWASSPWGRVFFQFKRYGFNQGRLLRRELLDETVKYFKTNGRDGSLRAWGPFLTLYPTAGWMVGAIRDWISGKETPGEKVGKIVDEGPKELLLQMVDAYTWVGGVGIVSDVTQQLSWSEETALMSLLGPTSGIAKSILGVAKQGITGVQRAAKGEDVEPEKLGAAALRSAVRGNLPIFGYPAARGELPFGVENETLKRIFKP